MISHAALQNDSYLQIIKVDSSPTMKILRYEVCFQQIASNPSVNFQIHHTMLTGTCYDVTPLRPPAMTLILPQTITSGSKNDFHVKESSMQYNKISIYYRLVYKKKIITSLRYIQLYNLVH